MGLTEGHWKDYALDAVARSAIRKFAFITDLLMEVYRNEKYFCDSGRNC